MVKIVVIGSVLLDLAVYTPAFADDGVTMTGERIQIGAGGKGYNQAVAIQKAGAEMRMVAKLGKDLFSRILFEHYEKIGICTDYMVQDADVETGSAVIEINTNTAQNRIILLKGGNTTLTAQDVQRAEDEIRDADAVVTQLETSLEAVREAKRLARKYGKKFILNPAPFGQIDPDTFRDVDYLTPNQSEAEYFTGIKVEAMEDAASAADVLLKMGAKNVIITMGDQGSFYTDGHTQRIVPVVSPAPAVDTTGAGDAYTGALSVALAEGKEITEALNFAACAAGIKVSRRGASAAMAERNEIDALYKERF